MITHEITDLRYQRCDQAEKHLITMPLASDQSRPGEMQQMFAGIGLGQTGSFGYFALGQGSACGQQHPQNTQTGRITQGAEDLADFVDHGFVEVQGVPPSIQL